MEARETPPSRTAIEGPPTASAATDPGAVGGEFVDALAARDASRIAACFRPDARLRALVPSGPQEHSGRAALAKRLVSWFEEAATIRVLDRCAEPLADLLHLRYRFREGYADGESEIIEQDAFCRVEKGRIVAMDLVCSGHRPEPKEKPTGVHHFDAGELGCGSGLPQEFRHEISAIPVGSVLEVVARDPSAREDLPSLARLLGHRVLSVAALPDGSTVLSVQRVR
jgi:TusA-related sulfurtransferase